MRRLMFALPLAAVLLVLAAPAAGAQPLPIEWGKVSDAERAITEVPGDPDATAIVLGDVGLVSFDAATRRQGGGLRVVQTRHRRVKVFSEAGYEQGEVAFRYSGSTEVDDVRGQTFVPQPDGSLRRVELSRSAVFREKVRDGVTELRFTMPALTPGAVFEYSYTVSTTDIVSLEPWYFQSDEPTLISEYRVEAPQELHYILAGQGQFTSHPREPGTGRLGRTDRMRWTAAGVPALRDEPYTTTEEDYAAKVSLQLQRIVPERGYIEEILSTWPKLADELKGNDAFGKRLRSSRYRRSLFEGIAGTPDERAREVYDRVRTGYVWNGRGGVFAERDLDDVAEARGGTAPELALLLTQALRDADVQATPALLSTRSNGRTVEDYPLVNQFDWVLVEVTQPDGSTVLLDATDPQRPFGVLPVQALNGRAWVADATSPRWIGVPAPDGTATTSIVEATLGADGQLAGTVQLRLSGYAAQEARTDLVEKEADAPAQAGAGGAAGAFAEAADAPDAVELSDVTVEGDADVDGPLTLAARFTAPAAEAIGDELYLTPFVLLQIDENPFQRTTRTFPVDFAYPFQRTYVASIALPDGYQASEIPEPVRITTPGRAVSYSRVVGVSGGRLVVRADLKVTASQVQPQEYPALRQLYDEIVASETEAIVLVRAGAVPPAAPAPESEPTPEEEPAAEAAGETGGQQ